MVACRVLNPGPKEVAQQAISKLGGPPDFLGGDVEGEAARESARMKERANSGPASPSVSLAAKQDVLEQSNFAGDSDWGCAAQAEHHVRLPLCAQCLPEGGLSALMIWTHDSADHERAFHLMSMELGCYACLNVLAVRLSTGCDNLDTSFQQRLDWDDSKGRLT